MNQVVRPVAARTATERFAEHAIGARLADVPAEAVARAKVFILDTVGVGIAGSSAGGADEVLRAAQGWGAGADAAVWGRKDRLPAPQAALLNGFQAHCQEYDCVHEPAVLHPMATLLPAAFAWAERAGGVSGADLLMAVAVGVNVATGLGVASNQGLRFFRPATAGGFGAVAATGRLAGMSADALVGAFGLQYAQTSGTMQAHVEGNIALPMQVGFNGRAALQAVDLAGQGIAGPRDVFEGQFGYMRLFEGGWDLAPVLDALDSTWRVAQISHKPYPSGRATHGGIEGVTVLRDQHGFGPDDLRRVVVHGPPLIVRLCGRPSMPGMTASYARLCMGFAIANVLRFGKLDLSQYRGAALDDPATLAIAARVETRSDGSEDPNALLPSRVEVVLNDGRTLEWTSATLLASPARPLTHEQHLAKFRRCWEFAADPLGEAKRDALIEAIDRLEAVEDIRTLAALLQP